MRKVVFLLITLTSFLSKAQLPYLNASTGNAGEFPVDTDTNMYLFHGNRLVKTDKNFNTIWANTYGNLQFKNLLLSKTRSMFFIAGNSIGKIEGNGTISWCKDLNNISAVINNSASVNYTISQLHSLLLDRNNQLLITGNITPTNIATGYAFYLKLDTLGNPLKLAPFEGYLTNNFSIINDSLGYYRFMGGGGPSSLSFGYIFGFSMFNDISNNFISGKVYTNPDTQFTDKYTLVRSQFNSGFYIHSSINYNYNLYRKTSVTKFYLNGNIKWGRTFDNCLPPTFSFWGDSRSLIEDNSGNIFIQVNSSGPDKYGVLKIDSNGFSNNSAIITHSFNTFTNPQHLSVQKITGDDLYTQFVANGDPINPLKINQFKSSLGNSCYTVSSCNSYFSGMGGSGTTLQTPTLQLVTSFSITSQSLTSTTATFAVNTKSCTLLSDVGLNENKLDNQLINLHPNPTSNILKFDLTNSAEIEEVLVLDVNGKVLKTHLNCKEISVSELTPGIYFLQLKSDGQIYYSKFIKE